MHHVPAAGVSAIDCVSLRQQGSARSPHANMPRWQSCKPWQQVDRRGKLAIASPCVLLQQIHKPGRSWSTTPAMPCLGLGRKALQLGAAAKCLSTASWCSLLGAHPVTYVCLRKELHYTVLKELRLSLVLSLLCFPHVLQVHPARHKFTSHGCAKAVN